ncbi:capsular biosynthesis protein [Pradoshia sp. D12]|nr:capsular biosynthesis protein [Pradoshia sp. D12]TPF72383.1 capsular biosynthesis protein [Bacillus sp. D12]
MEVGMEDTVSFKDILSVLKRRLVLIILMTLIAALASGIISYLFLSPSYESSTQILVNDTMNTNEQQNQDKKTKKEDAKTDSNETNLIDPNQVRANIELIHTYSMLIKSQAILADVISELSLDRSIDKLNEQVTVNTTQNSQVVEIVVKDQDPVLAAKMADSIATVFQQEVTTLMNIDNIHILANANVEEPYGIFNPDMIRNVLIGFSLGLFCAIGVAFLLEYLDPTIRDEKDILYELGIPVIGNIPEIKVSSKSMERQMEDSRVKIGGRTFES